MRLRLRSEVALRGFFRLRREHLAPPKNHSRRAFVNFARQMSETRKRVSEHSGQTGKRAEVPAKVPIFGLWNFAETDWGFFLRMTQFFGAFSE